MTKAEWTELATGLEHTRVQAMVDKDVNKLRELFSDDLYYGHTGGYADSKSSMLEKISAGTYSYTSITARPDRADAIGDSGLALHGQLTLEVTLSGEPKMIRAIYIAVWRKENDTWRLLSLQAALAKV